MKHGIDVSNFSGAPTRDALAAVVNSQNISRITIAAQFPDTWRAWYPIAAALGLEIDAYIFLYNDGRGSYGVQTRRALDTISGGNVYRLWLDLEDYILPDGTAVPVPAPAQIQDAIDTCGGFPAGIYTSQGYWAKCGNPQFGRQCPLWVASWGTDPADFSVAWGGWLAARGKQYVGEESSYGLTFGLDSWDE